MVDARFSNGQVQPLYFLIDHDKAGWFKGMVQILVEHGYANVLKLPTECKDFKCFGNQSNYCCWHVMYSQSDFVKVESLLEVTCCGCGFDVIFLLKFHCEPNFIRQC